MGEKTLTEDGRKIVEEEEVEAVNPSFATIMAKHKPNPWGKGHLQLYALAAICFLNSTMSGSLYLSLLIAFLTLVRFRWLAHGQHQRSPKLYQIFWPSTDWYSIDRNRFCNLPDRADVRRTVRLGGRLARPPVADLYRDDRSHSGYTRYGNCEDIAGLYRWQIST